MKPILKNQNLDVSVTEHFKYQPPKEHQKKKTQKNPYDPRVFQFDRIRDYYLINRPEVGQQKRKMIQEKLQLDKQAEVQAFARLKLDHKFVNYERNPFIDQNMIKPSEINTNLEKQILLRGKISKSTQERLQQEPQNQHLVKALNNLSQKQFHIDQTSITANLRWQEMQQIPRILKKQADHDPPFHSKIPLYMNQTIQEENQNLTFDEIVKIQEQSYYVKKQGDINIFQFLKNNHKPFVTDALLDKFYFCHNSIMDKITTKKFPIVRDISKIGRKFAKDHRYKQPHRLDHISSNEINFKIGDTKFQDLLSIASGRFNPQIVYKSSNQIQIREENHIKTEISSYQINYTDDANNIITNYQDPHIEYHQIKDYIKLENTLEEERYQNRCDRIYKAIQTELIKKSQLTGNTIKDKKLHQQINDSVNNKIKFYANMDARQQEADKKIRQNKLTKNRNQAIKIRSLLNSITLKNKEEQKIKILLEGSNK